MESQNLNVLLQNLRNFTVQIRNAKNDIVGTGFIVSTDGRIVTCAHVLRAAGVEPRNASGRLVNVYFPKAPSEASKLHTAQITAYFPQHDDDVVILQLLGDLTFLSSDYVAILGKADESFDHTFRSYGFRPLPPYSGGWANGIIQGDIDPPIGKTLQVDPVQLESTQIDAGMSGAPILDEIHNLVVGIVSQAYHSDPKTLKDHDTAWAINARVLSLDPFNLSLRELPLPRRPAPGLELSKDDITAIRATVTSNPGVRLTSAPPSLSEWVGRNDLLKALSSDWVNPQRQVTALIGFGGEGKSSLARRWIDLLLENTFSPQPRGIFWWSFYEQDSVSTFFNEAFTYLTGGQKGEKDPKVTQLWGKAPAQVLGAMLGVQRFVFVLDGLEVMQYETGDQYGLLKDERLRKFLDYFASPGHQSFCLITSRVPMFDLIGYTTYIQRDVDHLSRIDGRALLRRIGVSGSDSALDNLVVKWDGYALALSLLGANLVREHGGDIAYASDYDLESADDSRYERIHRILRRYDEHSTSEERAFLILFSALRLPVNDTTFKYVFRTKTNILDTTISRLDDTAFSLLIKGLQNNRILRYDPKTEFYSTHILIRNHYLKLLNMLPRAERSAIHQNIAKYYRSTTPFEAGGGGVFAVQGIKGSINTGHPLLAVLGLAASGLVALYNYRTHARQQEARYHLSLAEQSNRYIQEEQRHLRLAEGQEQDM